MVDYGEQTTGTRDEHYNLISVLYHALSGADTCERYALDAETVGDERLAAFFRETQVMHSQIAERAKGLLGILEHPPEFGTSPARGSTPASRSTPDMPRTPLRTRRGMWNGEPYPTLRSFLRRRTCRPTSLPRRAESRHRGKSHHLGRKGPRGGRAQHRRPRGKNRHQVKRGLGDVPRLRRERR